LIASIGISQVVERNSSGGKEEVQTQPIFVAMVDMGIGQELNAQAVKLEEWPIDKIPEGAVTDAAQIEGMCPNQRMFAGEPLLLGKISDSDSMRKNSQTIKKGYRVVSVKVDMASSVSYLITPGDRVDVLAFSGSGGRSQAEAILANIEVFAINDKVTREVDGEGSSMQAKTVSLLVTPSQATKLMAHSYHGRINLSLRRPDDDEDSVEEIADLEPVAPPVETGLPVFETDFSPEPADSGFVMEVLEGGSAESVRRYTWDTDSELPRELTSVGSSGGEELADEASDDFPFPIDEEGEEGEPADGEETPSRDGSSFRYSVH
jgi:pilus assembly protein CpaB